MGELHSLTAIQASYDLSPQSVRYQTETTHVSSDFSSQQPYTPNPMSVPRSMPFSVGEDRLKHGMEESVHPITQWVGSNDDPYPFAAGMYPPYGNETDFSLDNTHSTNFILTTETGPTLDNDLFLAPQMSRRVSSNSDSDEYSPTTFRMSSHTRSYSNGSIFGHSPSTLSSNTLASPMSREASNGSASQLPAAIGMMRMNSTSAEAPYPATSTGLQDTEPCTVEALPLKAPKMSRTPKRRSTTSVELLDTQAAQAPRDPTASSGPRPRRASKSPRTAQENWRGGHQGRKPPGRKPYAQQPIAPAEGLPTQRGTPVRIKPAGQKPKYVRPQHPRVKCDMCPPSHEGFRGDHEVRRHYLRAHAEVKHMWEVRDMSKDGKLLSKCKACSTGRQYGIDYNATAHLKRQHFNTDKDPKLPVPENLREWIVRVEVKNGAEVSRRRRSSASSITVEEHDDGPKHEADENEEMVEQVEANVYSHKEPDMYLGTADFADQKYSSRIMEQTGFPESAVLDIQSTRWEGDSQMAQAVNYQFASDSGVISLESDVSLLDTHKILMQEGQLPTYLGQNADGSALNLEQYFASPSYLGACGGGIL